MSSFLSGHEIDEKKDVFISYSHKDSTYANKLIKELTKYGLSVWIDQQSIEYGTDWKDEINKGLIECHVIIIIVSDNSKNSKWVQYEVNSSKWLRDYEKENNTNIPPRRIIPLVLGHVDWDALSQFQAIKIDSRNLPPREFFIQISEFVSLRKFWAP